jgi:hypothetical protein
MWDEEIKLAILKYRKFNAVFHKNKGLSRVKVPIVIYITINF